MIVKYISALSDLSFNAFRDGHFFDNTHNIINRYLVEKMGETNPPSFFVYPLNTYFMQIYTVL